MNGICKVLGTYYGAQPVDDTEREWRAIRVGKDGNVVHLSGPCSTIEEAEEIAGIECELDLKEADR